jgi:uncharacterized protein YigA (DUF484 family)
MEMLRDKIKGLEHKIIEMIRNGQDNLALADKLHRWTRAIMLVRDAAQVPAVLVAELRHQFLIPQAGLRLWGVAEAHAGQPFAQPVGDDVEALPSASLPTAASTPASRPRVAVGPVDRHVAGVAPWRRCAAAPDGSAAGLRASLVLPRPTRRERRAHGQ